MDAHVTALASLLPSDTYYQTVHTLNSLLPPPVTDTPEDTARRDRAAMAHVASLRPADPEEANLAAQYVAASVQALDSLRLARLHPTDPAHVLKCTAQSASMMRQARGWRTALLRAQAARQKGDPEAAIPDTAGAEPAAPVVQTDAPSEEPEFDAVAEAERYATLHRKRAMLIRSLRGVPRRLDIGPIRPEVVRALISGTTPILRALDEKPRRPAALAA
jgi:hypothetical protein